METRASLPKCSAIIVASGGSRRMGFDKLTAQLAGQAVLCRTLDALAAVPEVAEIVLVCPQDRWEALERGSLVRPRDSRAKTPANHQLQSALSIIRVNGGTERQDSVAAGLAAATMEFSLVHDGARPLVAPTDITRCIEAAITHGAAALARRVVDTLQRADPEGFAEAVIDRTALWAIETPQCAPTALLRQALAHATAAGIRVTDETSALASLGVRVRLVESQFPNPKITTPGDLAVAEALISL